MALNLNHYQLTIDNLTPVKFWANNSQLKYRLNSAYIAFKNKHNVNKMVLHVHHPAQGWYQVHNVQNVYPVINNPLLLNYNALIMAIIHTLAEADLHPTAQQKQQRKEKALQVERNIDAQIQRGYFYIVKSGKDT
jgi:hypothetical protein